MLHVQICSKTHKKISLKEEEEKEEKEEDEEEEEGRGGQVNQPMNSWV